MTAKEILTEAKLQDTYWGKIIIEAEQRPGFSVKEQIESGKWNTCACGRMTVDVPRKPGAECPSDRPPQDQDLFSLGMNFYDFVNENDFAAAAETLVHIEQRALVVSAEWHKQKD